jgi:glycosyltransferase involved in cell wall biosynthesis
MRVLHVASGRLFGGVEQMLVTMARERAATRELEAVFAIAAPGRLHEELTAAGVPVHALGDARLSRPGSIVRARARLRALVESQPPDALVCHAPWSYGIFAPVARRAGVPAILWQHDRADGRSMVERWAARTPAALVIATSAWTAESAAALQPGAPVTVIHPCVAPSPVPADARAALRHSLGAGRDDVVVITASRLEPWKGHRNLLRALAGLRTETPWQAWMAGGAQRPHEQAYLSALRAEVESLGLAARVRFLGERTDVPALMQAADLYCQPNDMPEPFGVVFAEALLAERPVVTADMGGAPEIVSEECGRLVARGDTVALTRVLAELIDDAALRARLGAAGPRRARARCAPEVVLPQIAAAVARLGSPEARKAVEPEGRTTGGSEDPQ